MLCLTYMEFYDKAFRNHHRTFFIRVFSYLTRQHKLWAPTLVNQRWLCWFETDKNWKHWFKEAVKNQNQNDSSAREDARTPKPSAGPTISGLSGEEFLLFLLIFRDFDR